MLNKYGGDGVVGAGGAYDTNGMNGININNGGTGGIASVDMSIVALQETNNPFPFHEKRQINWRTQVGADDKETLKHERIKTILKALTKQRTIKSLYEKHWNKYIFHLIAQDLSPAFTHILSVLFDTKKSSPDMVVTGLDALPEIMRTDHDGEFLEQHQLNDELLEKVNRYLPSTFVHTEPAFVDA